MNKQIDCIQKFTYTPHGQERHGNNGILVLGKNDHTTYTFTKKKCDAQISTIKSQNTHIQLCECSPSHCCLLSSGFRLETLPCRPKKSLSYGSHEH